MILRRYAGISLLCACYFFLTAHLSFRFPPVNSDETSSAVQGFNFWNGAGNRYSLYDNVFAPSIYQFRDASPDSTEFIFNVWIGACMKLIGKSYWHARLSSVIAGTLALGAIFLLGSYLGGRPAVGYVSAAFLALNPVFLTASCLVRPEMLFFLLGLLCSSFF